MIKDMASSHSRALDDVVALVGHARPHLVDAWDALAVLESSGYTDARVKREFGLADTRELAELVYAQLSSRPLPVSTSDGGAGDEADARPALRTTIAIAVAWAALVYALTAVLRISPGILRLALVPGVVICCGFVEAMRRRGAFYAAIDQPWLGRVTCWYFMRLAALLIAVVTVAGLAAGWMAGARWPVLALWADTFVVSSALWLLGGAMQVPGMLSSRRKTDRDARVAIPRMTVVAYRELRVLAVSALAALVVGVLVSLAAGYAAVGIIGGASLTFVVSTMAGRWSATTRSVSFS
jgi:hypothetical protein